MRALWWSKSKQKETSSQIFFACSCGFMLLFPLPVGADGGSDLLPGLPFLFLGFTSHVFCLMGRVSFLFAIPCAYLILSSLSCKLCYLRGSCLHAFPCLLNATTQILACPRSLTLLTYLFWTCLNTVFAHAITLLQNTYILPLFTVFYHICILIQGKLRVTTSLLTQL